MTGKCLKLLNALLLTTVFFLGAFLAYKLILFFPENPLSLKVGLINEPVPPAISEKSLDENRAFRERRQVITDTARTVEPGRIDTSRIYKSDLELKLLGTVITDGGKKFAVIEETAEGRQQLYQEAGRIQGAVIQKIARGKAVLLVNGRREILKAERVLQIAETGQTESGQNNEARRTALMEAVNQGHRGKIALLLAQGEDVNARDAYGNTALILAARSGRSDIVRLLIDQGADVNLRDNVGNTPLIDSARYPGKNALDVIEILIAGGADVQAKNIYNNTALMNAVRSGQTDLVELLLSEGADINARAKNGQTALKLASDSLRKDVVAVLKDYGAMLQ